MRDRKISIETAKAAPRSFRLRDRFARSRAPKSGVPVLRDFCNSPSEGSCATRLGPQGPVYHRGKHEFQENRAYYGGKLRFGSLCSDGALHLEMQLRGVDLALCN